MRRSRKAGLLVWAVLVCGLSGYLTYREPSGGEDLGAVSGSLAVLELRMRDWEMRYTPPSPLPARLILLPVETPLPLRDGQPTLVPLAEAISVLGQAGASLIVCDFPLGPSPGFSPDLALLAGAVQAGGNVVISYAPTSPWQAPPLAAAEPADKGPQGQFVSAAGFLPPPDDLARAAKALGVATTIADVDRVNRCFPSFVAHGPAVYPSLPLAAALAHWGEKQPPAARVSRGVLYVGQHRIPVLQDGLVQVNFSGLRPFLTVPLAELLRMPKGDPRLDDFRGSIVVIGFAYPEARVAAPLPGKPDADHMELVAHALATLLSSKFVHPAHPAVLWSLLALLATLVGWGLPHLKTRAACLAVAGVLVAYLLVCSRVFRTTGVLLPVVGPCLALVVGFGVVCLQMLAWEQRARERLLHGFSRYVPRQVVETTMAAPVGAPRPAYGERRMLSAMFVDVRGFTALAETAPPEDVVALLNLFFRRMSEIVFAHGGMVDKYIGDCLMAVFGAIEEEPDHAERAVRTALEIQREARIMEDEWRFAGGRGPLRVSIGVASGPAVLGEVGYELKTDFTAVGDTVNIAQRLQDVCRDQEALLVISASTYVQVRDRVDAEDIGAIAVRGRTEPVEAYKVIGLKPESL